LDDLLAVLNFAIAASRDRRPRRDQLGVLDYLTNSVSQWVAHDLQRMLYHHIQRLSLAEHNNPGRAT
jgi:hypothetical protein